MPGSTLAGSTQAGSARITYVSGLRVQLMGHKNLFTPGPHRGGLIQALEPVSRISWILAVLLLTACSRSSVPTPSVQFIPCSPIAGLEDPDIPSEARTTVLEAQEDFCAVLANREPTHAHKVSPPSTITKSGSTYYVGRGYRLTVVRDTFETGGAYFGLYGPVLHFDSRVPGQGEMSQVRVVTLPRMH